MAGIRRYSPLDYPHVRRNLEEAGIFYEVRDSEENLQGMIDQDPDAVQVAEVEEEIVGSIVFSNLGPNLAVLWSRVVAERYRRQGIGSQLVHRMEEILEEKGVIEIWRFIDEANGASLASSLKEGYQYNPAHKYFGPWKSLRRENT